MATKTRRGSWRKVAPGQYVKQIGTYGSVKFGATVRVSFVPFPTCEILNANGAHVAIPTPADAKKYIAAAKKVYTKDETAAAAKSALPRATPPPKLPKWHSGMVHTIGFGWTEQPSAYERQTSGHKGRRIAIHQQPVAGIHGSIRELQADVEKYEYMASIPGAKTAMYKKRAASIRARIKKLRA